MSTNIEVLSATHGIAPRSDELLRIGGDVERGRLDRSVFEDRLDQEQQDWLELQRLAGIDFVENGKLRWQDHLRPIVKASGGFASDIDDAPVTRWLETNTFYRQPTIVGPLTLDPKIFVAEVGPPGDYISLLAPDSFSRLVSNVSGIDRRENVDQLYQQLFDYFQIKGVKRVTLVDVFGGTFTERLLGQVQNTPTEIWQPVIDSGNTATRPVRVDNWLARDHQEPGPIRLVLTHTVDLERLPLPYAQAKVKQLGEISLTLQQHFEEKS